MKSKILIAGLICATAIPPAAAVTKCVKLSSSATCSSNSNAAVGQSNWSATCDGVSVQGVAFCGSQNGGSNGATTDAVTTSSTSNNNKYCWCKMVSPAVSRWVFSYTANSAGTCAQGCASSCAGQIPYYSNLRGPLFSGLSD